jgi:hypothetical protein
MQILLKSKADFAKANPEEINFQDFPSKRINELSARYRKHRYNKYKDSLAMFRNLDFEKVYDTCPYFRGFRDELRSFAGRC